MVKKMHLLIDGYNLIHASGELLMAYDRGAGEEALASALNLYRKKRSHRITIILDGGEDPEGSKASLKGIPVIYSGARESADDVIARLCSHQGPGATVITDDRELKGRCRVHGSLVMGSHEFSRRLLEAAMDMVPMDLDDDDQGWDFTTRKKGPSRREPKSKRLKNKRFNKI
ncbi:hypothetical protein X474_23610 [Dethiosulfatarculus sandiegensis]|uniref:RNA-binding protein n=2 Tax=Dethiosulfatarculus sandiegensis TaxID=1429043 RepID=A0A0D2J768_9BACT|nr:hypothetical protein X474_23610 [Dethiosulfatarculus sandiegensis]